jgi:hypothetical protein
VACTSARTATTAAAQLNGIMIAPNPSTSLFTITAPGSFKYTIYDQLGRLVESGKGQSRTQFGQRLIQGTYTLQIEYDSKVQSMKIVKQ